jgi:hypothetical protein
MSPVKQIKIYHIHLADVPPIEWYRVGGYRFEFFASTEEIQRWLREELPPEYAPYSLIIIGELRKRRIDQLCELVRKGNSQFYLYSKKLTPDLDKARKPFMKEYRDERDVQLGFSGLILLQFSRISPNSICLVDKVRYVPTNELQHRQNYKPLFSMLKRKIRKQLLYYAKLGRETWERPMATQGFASAVRDGRLKGYRRQLKLSRSRHIAEPPQKRAGEEELEALKARLQFVVKPWGRKEIKKTIKAIGRRRSKR